MKIIKDLLYSIKIYKLSISDLIAIMVFVFTSAFAYNNLLNVKMNIAEIAIGYLCIFASVFCILLYFLIKELKEE